MGILSIKDFEENILLMRRGICPRWGFLAKSNCRNSLTRGKWTVNKDGDIAYDGYYHIQKARLREEDWITHLMSKSWFDFNEFMPIFLQACVNAGIEEITIRTHKKS